MSKSILLPNIYTTLVLLQIILLGDLNKRLPFVVLGGSALLGGIFALLNLPETLGKKLPETMEEALNLNKKAPKETIVISLCPNDN